MPEAKKKWFQEDWTQELGLLVIGAIAVAVIWKSPEAKDVITVAVGAVGVIGGYLTGKKVDGG